MEKADIIIVGAGIIGLAIAEKISGRNKTLFILEKNRSFGMETSSRNSEVLHSGIYYPTGSLRHRLCIEGNGKLYSLCRSTGINFKQLGKFIVATDEAESDQLHELFVNGKKNEVPGLKLVPAFMVREQEPFVICKEAIHSPTAGIVDTHQIMKYFLDTAIKNGAQIVYNTEVKELEKNGKSGYIIGVKESSGGGFEFKSDIVINCAGLDSEKVARMAGIDVKKEDYRIKYCKGSYFRINPSEKINIEHLIYPAVAKNSVSLGIHVTPDLGGGIRLGPDAEYISGEEKDYSVDENKREKFYNSARRFIPSLKKDMLYPDTAGIRPKLQGPDEDFRDFIIKEESEKGLSGFINLLGIDSPGLTAAPAIARMVKEQL